MIQDIVISCLYSVVNNRGWGEVLRGVSWLPSENANFAQFYTANFAQWSAGEMSLDWRPAQPGGRDLVAPLKSSNCLQNNRVSPLLSSYIPGDFTISPSYLRRTVSSSDSNSKLEYHHFTLFPDVRLLQLWDNPCMHFPPDSRSLKIKIVNAHISCFTMNSKGKNTGSAPNIKDYKEHFFMEFVRNIFCNRFSRKVFLRIK